MSNTNTDRMINHQDGLAIIAALEAMGVDRIGLLTALETTDKTSLVGAINENTENLAPLIHNNAGAHNGIYRGKNLGTSVTAEQYAAIAAGTFDDLYIGDYWVINNVTYRIAGFDYWYNVGSSGALCSTHHVVIVPDTCLYNAVMNDSHTTEGGYLGSKMYTTNLEAAKTIVNTAFGSTHILTHESYLSNAVANGASSNWINAIVTVDLMNECMVYGSPIVCNNGQYGNLFDVGYEKTQLPLFAFRPDLIVNRAIWWLRVVSTATLFAVVNDYGRAYNASAGGSFGVRPAFAIKAA